MNMINIHELVAAFVDGERVDSSQLAAALAAPEGREYLIDVLALRELVEDGTPPVELARTPPLLRWRWLSLAAAVFAAAALGGYAAGVRQGERRIVATETAVVTLPASVQVPAPRPTQVIRFQSGVNWQEQIGGH